MDFFTRNIRAAALLPLLAATLTIRWTLALPILYAVIPPASLTALLAIPVLFPVLFPKQQQRRHADVPPALLRFASLAQPVAEAAYHPLNRPIRVFYTLAGANTSWPIRTILPRRPNTTTRRPA